MYNYLLVCTSVSGEPTLRITNAGPDDAGDYIVRITNASGGIVDSDIVSLSISEFYFVHIVARDAVAYNVERCPYSFSTSHRSTTN